MSVTQLSQDLRALRRDFIETLKRLEPALLGVATDVATIKGSLAHLPTKWTIRVTALSSVIAIVAIFLTIGSPKEFLSLMTEIVRSTNQSEAQQPKAGGD